MSDMNDLVKAFALEDELRNACKLIEQGLGELQEMKFEDEFYHLPHQLLASGLERLMKCILCFAYKAEHGKYPDNRFLKDLGHDLQELKNKVTGEVPETDRPPLLEMDYAFIVGNVVLNKGIHILSEFGKKARYYNFDLIAGEATLPLNPDKEWEELLSEVEGTEAYIHNDDMGPLLHEYYQRANAKIITKLERFLRFLSRLFVAGEHTEVLRTHIWALSSFRSMRDEDFGETDYRRSVKLLQKKRDTWSKRAKEEVLKSPWPSRHIARESFEGEWPFRSADDVVVECREGLFCIVNIGGYDFALNGAAASRYQYPFPHEAGLAVIGKSIGPFINVGLSLSKSV